MFVTQPMLAKAQPFYIHITSIVHPYYIHITSTLYPYYIHNTTSYLSMLPLLQLPLVSALLRFVVSLTPLAYPFVLAAF